MNRKKLIDKLLENWFAKIVCFLIAVFIYIFHQVTMLEKKTITVPLTVESSGVLCPVSQVPKFIKVNIRSTKELIPSIYSSGFKATINLDNITEKGTYVLPINLTLSEGLLLTDPLEVSIKPETVKVELDEKIMKYIPVEPAVSGSPEHGYTVKEISVSPSTVKVIGPSSVVLNTKSIYTKKVMLTGAAKSFSNDVKLDNVVGALNTYPEGDFKVSVNVVPADYEKKFENLSVKVLNLDEKLQLESEPSPVYLVLGGTMPLLEKFEFEEGDISINLEEIKAPGSYAVPLNVKIPASAVFLEPPEENITVNVIEKPVAAVETVPEENADAAVVEKPAAEEVKEESRSLKEKWFSKSKEEKHKEKNSDRNSDKNSEKASDNTVEKTSDKNADGASVIEDADETEKVPETDAEKISGTAAENKQVPLPETDSDNKEKEKTPEVTDTANSGNETVSETEDKTEKSDDAPKQAASEELNSEGTGKE